MFNRLYGYLVNRAMSDISHLIGSDLLPASFVPVERHPTAEQIARWLFGEEPQSIQFWICRARQIIRAAPLAGYVSVVNLEGGFRLDDIAADLQRYRKPVLIDPAGNQTVLTPQGDLTSDTYRIHDYRVALESGLVKLRSEAGGLLNEFTPAAGQVSLLLSGQSGCRVAIEQLPGTIRWAARPELNTAARYDVLRHRIAPLIDGLARQPSCFSPSQLRELAGLTDMTLQSGVSFAAAALLVAGHTAARYDDSL